MRMSTEIIIVTINCVAILSQVFPLKHLGFNQRCLKDSEANGGKVYHVVSITLSHSVTMVLFLFFDCYMLIHFQVISNEFWESTFCNPGCIYHYLRSTTNRSSDEHSSNRKNHSNRFELNILLTGTSLSNLILKRNCLIHDVSYVGN